MLKPGYIPVLLAAMLLSVAAVQAQFVLEAPSHRDETNYRWFEASNPNTVLGTNSWFEVYTPGVYYATYDGTLCGKNATSYFIVTYCNTPDNQITLDISQKVPDGASVSWNQPVSGDPLSPTVEAPSGEGNITTYTATVSRPGNVKTLPSFTTICLYAPFSLTDDQVSTEENQTITISMLDNDSNIPAIGVLDVSNPTNGSVTIDMNGTLNNPSDDTILYTPNAGYMGTDTFTYSLSLINSDGSVMTEEASISVTVNGEEGAVDDWAEIDLSVQADVNIPVLENDVFSSASSVEIISNTEPQNGTVRLESDGTKTYVPNPGFEGEDTFTYTVAVIRGDGSAFTDTATVTVVVITQVEVDIDDPDDEEQEEETEEPEVPEEVTEIPAMTVHQLVTPNGDGQNDYLHIYGIENYPDNTVRLFNRWGAQIFEAKGYDNNSRRFEGISQGNMTIKQGDKLPSGTYYYVIEFHHNGFGKNKAGFFYINNDN